MRGQFHKLGTNVTKQQLPVELFDLVHQHRVARLHGDDVGGVGIDPSVTAHALGGVELNPSGVFGRHGRDHRAHPGNPDKGVELGYLNGNRKGCFLCLYIETVCIEPVFDLRLIKVEAPRDREHCHEGQHIERGEEMPFPDKAVERPATGNGWAD